MPVKFFCKHCRQKLKVTRRKIGTQIECPRCRGPLTVPTVQAAKAAMAVADTSRSAQGKSELAEFAVFDEVAPRREAGGSGIYGTSSATAVATVSVAPPVSVVTTPSVTVASRGEEQRAATARASSLARASLAAPTKAPFVRRQPGTSMLLVSRQAIFLQAALFLVLGGFTFTAGYLIGLGRSGPSGQPGTVAAQPASPVLMRGKITHFATGVAGDNGALIVVVPRGKQGKLDGRLFHPQSSAPAEGSPAALALEEMGGQFARADTSGDFSLRVPNGGEYYVLIVSRQARQAAGSDIRPEDRRQIEQYFVSAAELIGRQKYVLSLEQIDGGLFTKSHDFGASGS